MSRDTFAGNFACAVFLTLALSACSSTDGSSDRDDLVDAEAGADAAFDTGTGDAEAAPDADATDTSDGDGVDAAGDTSKDVVTCMSEPEECNSEDDDCDGVVDEGCNCAYEETMFGVCSEG